MEHVTKKATKPLVVTSGWIASEQTQRELQEIFLKETQDSHLVILDETGMTFMPAVGLCGTCKHWGHRWETTPKRICRKISGDISMDSIVCVFSLVTCTADFGCVLHEPKEEKNDQLAGGPE